MIETDDVFKRAVRKALERFVDRHQPGDVLDYDVDLIAAELRDALVAEISRFSPDLSAERYDALVAELESPPDPKRVAKLRAFLDKA